MEEINHLIYHINKLPWLLYTIHFLAFFWIYIKQKSNFFASTKILDLMPRGKNFGLIQRLYNVNSIKS